MKKISLLFFHKYFILSLVACRLSLVACRLSLLSQVCAVCAPTCVNIRRPVEQEVGIQSRSCNHVSAPKWNHKSSRGWLCSAFSHAASIIRVCIHSVCASSCAKYRLASDCRPTILTSWSVSCHCILYFVFCVLRFIVLYYTAT
jgi:hypothetical protein